MISSLLCSRPSVAGYLSVPASRYLPQFSAISIAAHAFLPPSCSSHQPAAQTCLSYTALHFDISIAQSNLALKIVSAYTVLLAQAIHTAEFLFRFAAAIGVRRQFEPPASLHGDQQIPHGAGLY